MFDVSVLHETVNGPLVNVLVKPVETYWDAVKAMTNARMIALFIFDISIIRFSEEKKGNLNQQILRTFICGGSKFYESKY